MVKVEDQHTKKRLYADTRFIEKALFKKQSYALILKSFKTNFQNVFGAQLPKQNIDFEIHVLKRN